MMSCPHFAALKPSLVQQGNHGTPSCLEGCSCSLSCCGVIREADVEPGFLGLRAGVNCVSGQNLRQMVAVSVQASKFDISPMHDLMC